MIGGLNQKHQLIQFSDQEINQAFQSFQKRMGEYQLFEIRNKAVYLNSHSDDEDDYENDEEVQQIQQQKSKSQSIELLIIENPKNTNKEKKIADINKPSKGLQELKNDQQPPVQVQNGAKKSAPIQNISQNLDNLETINKRIFTDKNQYYQKPCAKKSNMQ
ncbi:hypothetical protein ABPG74_012143 [Tetrahymena malaccensis]